MRKINKQTTLVELAHIICSVLRENRINAVLTGGAVVTIYTQNEYQSYDLGFITSSSLDTLCSVLINIGFEKKGRYFCSKDTDYYIEFPPPPLSVGDYIIRETNEIENEYGYLRLLTPTHCVMDRLAAFYFWNDRQSLEQALMVARRNKICFKEIEEWSKKEQSIDKYRLFISLLKENKSESSI